MQRRDFDGAEQALDWARKLVPNHAMVYAVAANGAMFAGKPSEATRLTQRAMRLCPVFPPWYARDTAQAHLQLGQLEDAIAWSKAAIDRSAGYLHAHLFRIIALHEMGDIAQARAGAMLGRQLDPAFDAKAWAAGQAFKDPRVNERFLRALMASGLS